MNLFLLLIVMAEICFGVCAWLSPGCLRWLAAHLLTRADVVDAARAVGQKRMQFWAQELELRAVDQTEETGHGFSRMHGVA